APIACVRHDAPRALHSFPTRRSSDLDAGTFAAPVYRNFPFHPSQRLVAPLSGAMGYGVPAAIACALNHPGRQVICMVGDGGFLRSEEHTSELQSRFDLVCRLLLENKK